MKCSLLASLCVLGISMLPCQAASASFTIEQVMSAPFASEPVASPKGAKVAWILNERGQRNIWMAEGPEWKGHKVTHFDQDDGQDIAELAWSPDGSYLLFSRGGDFENGGENPNPDSSPAKPDQSIWRVAANGDPKKLTEGKAPAISPKGDLVLFQRNGQIFSMKPDGEAVRNLISQKGTQEHMQWSPDGSMLAFVSDRRDHSFIATYSLADKSLRYLDASVDHNQEPVWSPDGSKLAFVRVPATARTFGFVPRREGEPWSIRVVDVKTGFAREAFRANDGPGSLFHPVVAERQISWADGDRLVFPWERTGWCHLYSVPTTGETAAELTPGEGEVEHVAISEDRKTIYFSANFAGMDKLDVDRRHVWSVAPSGAARPKAVTRGENNEWLPTPIADGSGLVLLASSYNQRAHAAIQTPGGELKDLAADAAPSEFPATSLVKPQQVILTAADGMSIHGQLFLPPNSKNGQKHPALVFFHGGSRRQMLLGFHYMYYYSNAYSLNQYFANQGYIVLSVNYRSGIGYGLNFREAINYGARGGSEFNDVIGAGLYLKSRADVDPKRIGVWGGSYGGYLTAMALSRASDLFAAGVDFHGVHDWSTLRGNFSAPLSGDPKERREQEEAARIAFESSPMASIDTWRSPVLLIHGDDDRNVAFAQTVTLVEALRQRHVDFEQMIIPNEIHDFLMQRHWVEAYQASADFFARKLRGATEMAQTHE